MNSSLQQTIMNCFWPKTLDEPTNSTTHVKHEVLLSFPNCRVHLVGSGEAVEIAKGDFSVVKLQEEGVAIATVIKVGDNLQWPLTKDEPVVKLDSCDYLFSLPMRGGKPLSYGVSFVGNSGGINLRKLDEFLRANSCFSSSNSSVKMKGHVNWKDYAPKVDDFNTFLAKAIAHGTGQVVKGIFMCSNAYTSIVQKAGQTMLTQPPVQSGSVVGIWDKKKKVGSGAHDLAVNENLKRVRTLSKMTDEISKAMLDQLGIVIGSAMAPVIKSEQGKKLLSMVPGQVLLVSLDALNRVIDAAEIAKKQALTATTAAATRMASQKFGEEATQNVFATTDQCVNIAWYIFKMRQALNPAGGSTGATATADAATLPGLFLKNLLSRIKTS